VETPYRANPQHSPGNQHALGNLEHWRNSTQRHGVGVHINLVRSAARNPPLGFLTARAQEMGRTDRAGELQCRRSCAGYRAAGQHDRGGRQGRPACHHAGGWLLDHRLALRRSERKSRTRQQRFNKDGSANCDEIRVEPLVRGAEHKHSRRQVPLDVTRKGSMFFLERYFG
jgi:hypothetical protein